MPMRRTFSSALIAVISILLLGYAAFRLGTASATPDRAGSIEQRLRCPVCKSVSIAESPSDTAAAMRQTVQQQVAAGRTDRQIVDYFRARYGNWVLLDPPAAGATLLLWVLAGLAAAVGATIVLGRTRRRRWAPTPTLTAEQRRQIEDAVKRIKSIDPTGQAL